jgi:hypothetical protein
MATSTVAVPTPIRARWIVSERTDLVWFTLGGAAAAYAFWALWRFAHVPLLVLVAIWAIVFDETHGFATISRTYLDAQERARRGRWLWGSLAFFLAVGPVLIFLGLGEGLEFVTILWGYFHIYRQHYGFLMMYKKKNRDLKPEDNRLDKIFFTAAFYYPFLTYPLHNADAARLLPFPIPPRLAEIYEHALLLSLLVTTLAYAVRQGKKWRAGLPLNWPKQVLLAAAVPINFVLFRSTMPLVGVYAAVTIYHNIQYHRLVWFYNQNKYGTEATEAPQYGLAALINSRWLAYVAVAALYAVLTDVVPRFLLRPTLGPIHENLRNQFIFSFFAAPGLLHYWIDGHIWKIRSDPTLRTYLQLDRP